jgi:hypothetical protein
MIPDLLSYLPEIVYNEYYQRLWCYVERLAMAKYGKWRESFGVDRNAILTELEKAVTLFSLVKIDLSALAYWSREETPKDVSMGVLCHWISHVLTSLEMLLQLFSSVAGDYDVEETRGKLDNAFVDAAELDCYCDADRVVVRGVRDRVLELAHDQITLNLYGGLVGAIKGPPIVNVVHSLYRPHFGRSVEAQNAILELITKDRIPTKVLLQKVIEALKRGIIQPPAIMGGKHIGLSNIYELRLALEDSFSHSDSDALEKISEEKKKSLYLIKLTHGIQIAKFDEFAKDEKDKGNMTELLSHQGKAGASKISMLMTKLGYSNQDVTTVVMPVIALLTWLSEICDTESIFIDESIK